MQVAVVGGGAAGFFAALSAKHHHPQASVTLYEKSDKLLSKVRISGGGRCNVTHQCLEIRKLAKHYPRGERFLKKSFTRFAVKDTIAWFAARGVDLKVEPDGRMFPVSDDSATIVDALMNEAAAMDVRIEKLAGVSELVLPKQGGDGGFRLMIGSRQVSADRVVLTSGGYPQARAYAWLAATGHTIVPPVPSLFTFNMPQEPIRELMGVVVPARVRLSGSDLESTGPVLITHWGLSGPAILRSSAWGARVLNELGHRFTVQLNWLQGRSEEQVRHFFTEQADLLDRKQAENANPFQLPKRFWGYLLAKAAIDPMKPWGTIKKTDKNRLVDLLTNDRYQVEGKTTFKEEFVTAGGVSLEEVDPLTLQSRKVPGLYFAGEVLDIDGITGGFNFQAAWTTGYLAGKLEP